MTCVQVGFSNVPTGKANIKWLDVEWDNDEFLTLEEFVRILPDGCSAKDVSDGYIRH